MYSGSGLDDDSELQELSPAARREAEMEMDRRDNVADDLGLFYEQVSNTPLLLMVHCS